MNTTSTHSPLQTVRGNCPATGRSASACTDQTHIECHIGAHESAKIDREVERELRRLDGGY